jgi:hypothetical protein
LCLGNWEGGCGHGDEEDGDEKHCGGLVGWWVGGLDDSRTKSRGPCKGFYFPCALFEQ